VKCEIFGCEIATYRRLSIGPGTSTALCETHYIEFKKELMGEDVVQNNIEKKGILEIKLDNVDIPNAIVLVDLLQEWATWIKTYGALLPSWMYKEDVGGLNELQQRTSEATQKWGRDG